jgi:hypothetical protein
MHYRSKGSAGIEVLQWIVTVEPFYVGRLGVREDSPDYWGQCHYFTGQRCSMAYSSALLGSSVMCSCTSGVGNSEIWKAFRYIYFP